MANARAYLSCGIAFSTLAVTLISVPASAQVGGDVLAEPASEITVTARRQNEKLADVPASITVLTSQDLAARGIVTTEQAIASTPGVTIVSNSAQVGDAQINIRGVNGARDAENNVALVVDGILKTNISAVNQYQGAMEQFEVLKGPQGAYYGRGATAGVIVMGTRKPGDSWAASGRTSWATQDSQLAEGSISGPLSENTGIVVFGQYRHTDGFYSNTGTDARTQGKTIDNYRGWGAGARLYSEPTDQLSLDAKFRYNKVKAAALNFTTIFALPDFASALGNPDFFQNVNDHKDFVYQRNVPSIDEQRTIEGSLKAEYAFDGVKLTAWGLFSDIDEIFYADTTAAGLGRFSGQASCIASVADLYGQGVTLQSPLFLGPTPGTSTLGAYSPTTCDGIQITQRDQRDLSGEIRLASDTDGPLQWSLGAYYLHINRHYGTAVNEDDGGDVVVSLYNAPGTRQQTSQLFDDRFKTDVYAGFGSLQYEPTDKLTLSAALRFDREERHVTPLVPNVPDPVTGAPINPGYQVGTLVPKSRTYQQAQPKLTLRYEFTPEVNVYLDYGVGFKAGGFNSQGSAALIQTYFNDLLGSNIGVNDDYGKEVSHALEAGFKASLFGGDVQLSGAVYRNIVDDMQFFEFYTGTFGILRVVSNIDKVRLIGGELGVTWRVAPGFTLDAGGNVLDSKIQANSVRPDTVGNKSPYSADYTLNVGASVEQPINDHLDFTFRADYRLTGPTWFHVVQDQTRRTVFDLFYPGIGTADYSGTRRDAYGILNLRAGLKGETWRLTGFVNNFFKKQYLEEIIPAPEFGGSFVTPGARRTIGLEAGFDF
ncbi:TonB-dependent receptor [Novosphingobium sp. BL-52-GroH]|uniref:TonB-dependent receptor n=1 Tax=Novosphingobium sp. BL-52-GroH TaxID=3349877 RepID=UPI00384D6304